MLVMVIPAGPRARMESGIETVPAVAPGVCTGSFAVVCGVCAIAAEANSAKITDEAKVPARRHAPGRIESGEKYIKVIDREMRLALDGRRAIFACTVKRVTHCKNEAHNKKGGVSPAS